MESTVGIGTSVSVLYYLNHIDCMPLGNISDTILMLVTSYEELDFIYRYEIDDSGFELDTRQMREILGGVSFSQGDVREFIKGYLEDNKNEVDAKFHE